MQEQVQQQHSPVKVYRTAVRLMIAAPMAGLEPENMLVEVTHEGRLMLYGDQRAMLKEVKATLAILRPAFKHDCTSTSAIFGNVLLALEHKLLCTGRDHKELHEDRTKER